MSNQYAPKKVQLDNGVTDVQCGAFHTCAIDDSKGLWVWGRNKTVCEPDDLKQPKKFIHIEGQPKIKQIRCGELHTLAITEEGEVWVWGDNKSKQLALGRGARTEEYLPVMAKNFPGTVDLLATGPGHAVALLGNGDVFSWG